VGDRVVLAGEPGVRRELLIEHAQEALRLRDITVARPLVLPGPPGKLVEEADLAEHRTDAAHLEHEPLDRPIAGRGLAWEEAAGLLREIDQDRARLEERQGFAAGTVGIDDRRDLVVGIEREKLRRHLLLALEADTVRL